MSPRLETDILADLIAKKRELLLTLRELTLRQAEVVPQGDMRELMTILSGKQTVLAQVRRLEEGLDHFRRQEPESRHWRTADDRGRCRMHAEDCNRLVQELMEIERSCETAMLHRRDDLSERLQASGNAASARAAYFEHNGPTSGGFNMESEA